VKRSWILRELTAEILRLQGAPSIASGNAAPMIVDWYVTTGDGAVDLPRSRGRLRRSGIANILVSFSTATVTWVVYWFAPGAGAVIM